MWLSVGMGESWQRTVTRQRDCQPGGAADMLLFKGQEHQDSFCPWKQDHLSPITLYLPWPVWLVFIYRDPLEMTQAFKTSLRKGSSICLDFLIVSHELILNRLIINTTLRVKILKWCVKTSTQSCFSTQKNRLEIKTEVCVIITHFLLRLLLLSWLFTDFLFHSDEAVCVKGHAICPLGGDLPTLIT